MPAGHDALRRNNSKNTPSIKLAQVPQGTKVALRHVSVSVPAHADQILSVYNTYKQRVLKNVLRLCSGRFLIRIFYRNKKQLLAVVWGLANPDRAIGVRLWWELFRAGRVMLPSVFASAVMVVVDGARMASVWA